MQKQSELQLAGTRFDFYQLAAQIDDLAYVRRARIVHSHWQQLLMQCRAARTELAETANMRLGVVGALIDDDWPALQPMLVDRRDATRLAELHRQWQPQLRVQLSPTRREAKIRRALRELAASLRRFNGNWKQYVAEVDLIAINRARQGYNDYYVLEKSCAFASEYIGQHGFEPLPMLTVADLLIEFPSVVEPRLR